MGNLLIFILSSFLFGLIALLLCYIGNKIFNTMKKDDYKTNKQLELAEKELNEKEN